MKNKNLLKRIYWIMSLSSLISIPLMAISCDKDNLNVFNEKDSIKALENKLRKINTSYHAKENFCNINQQEFIPFDQAKNILQLEVPFFVSKDAEILVSKPIGDKIIYYFRIKKYEKKIISKINIFLNIPKILQTFREKILAFTSTQTTENEFFKEIVNDIEWIEGVKKLRIGNAEILKKAAFLGIKGRVIKPPLNNEVIFVLTYQGEKYIFNVKITKFASPDQFLPPLVRTISENLDSFAKTTLPEAEFRALNADRLVWTEALNKFGVKINKFILEQAEALGIKGWITKKSSSMNVSFEIEYNKKIYQFNKTFKTEGKNSYPDTVQKIINVLDEHNSTSMTKVDFKILNANETPLSEIGTVLGIKKADELFILENNDVKISFFKNKAEADVYYNITFNKKQYSYKLTITSFGEEADDSPQDIKDLKHVLNKYNETNSEKIDFVYQTIKANTSLVEAFKQLKIQIGNNDYSKLSTLPITVEKRKGENLLRYKITKESVIYGHEVLMEKYKAPSEAGGGLVAIIKGYLDDLNSSTLTEKAFENVEVNHKPWDTVLDLLGVKIDKKIIDSAKKFNAQAFITKKKGETIVNYEMTIDKNTYKLRNVFLHFAPEPNNLPQKINDIEKIIFRNDASSLSKTHFFLQKITDAISFDAAVKQLGIQFNPEDLNKLKKEMSNDVNIEVSKAQGERRINLSITYQNKTYVAQYEISKFNIKNAIIPEKVINTKIVLNNWISSKMHIKEFLEKTLGETDLNGLKNELQIEINEAEKNQISSDVSVSVSKDSESPFLNYKIQFEGTTYNFKVRIFKFEYEILWKSKDILKNLNSTKLSESEFLNKKIQSGDNDWMSVFSQLGISVNENSMDFLNKTIQEINKTNNTLHYHLRFEDQERDLDVEIVNFET